MRAPAVYELEQAEWHLRRALKLIASRDPGLVAHGALLRVVDAKELLEAEGGNRLHAVPPLGSNARRLEVVPDAG